MNVGNILKKALNFLRNSHKSHTRLAVSNLPVSSLPTPRDIFFIVGHPKSGTTWLSTLLNTHPDIACKYEGHFFSRDDTIPTLEGVLFSSDKLATWMKKEYNNWAKEYNEELKTFVRLIILFYFQREAYISKKNIIGDKSPSYNIKSIHEFFPKAKVIHIIRDGRDVAVSMAYHRSISTERYMTLKVAAVLDEEIRKCKTTNGPIHLPLKYIINIAGTWKEEVSICRRDGRKYFGNRYLEIKYEDLSNIPEDTVKKVLTFLSVKYSARIIKSCIAKSSFSVLSGGRARGEENPSSFFRKGLVGDWKNIFRSEDKEAFNDISGSLLHELGYFAK